MSWNRQECDSQDGTLILPRKLAASPLVRRTLHNIAAITQQYLSFKRRPDETMATFLVRETLGYEEFSEALQRLWEEQAGVDPAKLNYGLPEPSDFDWDWWYDDDEEDGTSRGWQWWNDQGYEGRFSRSSRRRSCGASCSR